MAQVAKVLHAEGKIKSPESKTIPESDYEDLFGKYTARVVGSNSRSRANRLKSMGWEPKEKGYLDSLVEDEIPIMLKETGDFHGYGKVAASGSG